MNATVSVRLNPALIVEDDPAMQRRLLSLMAKFDGVQTAVAGDLAAAKKHLAAVAVGIALVDIGLPDGSGIDLIDWIQVHCPQVTVLVISAWGGEDMVLAALRAGAIGYLLKEREDVELELALASVQRGGAPIDPAVAKRILGLVTATATEQATPEERAFDALSEREVEVLKLVARGYSNREIAEITTLSRFTIEGYTKSIYRKLAVGSRTAAVFEAKALGLLR